MDEAGFDAPLAHAGFFSGASESQYGNFGVIDDGGKFAHAQAAQVGDGECAALQFVEANFVGACTLADVAEFEGQFQDVFAIHVFDDGNE